MKPRILLVNPPIYDFTAYDFWLKPYGLLSIAGFLRGKVVLRIRSVVVNARRPILTLQDSGLFRTSQIGKIMPLIALYTRPVAFCYCAIFICSGIALCPPMR